MQLLSDHPFSLVTFLVEATRSGGIIVAEQTILISLGGVTEARRSDKATAVVQLHSKRLNKERTMERDLTHKRNHVLDRGRGVTAAHQTFNLPGGGSNPPGPIERWACS